MEGTELSFDLVTSHDVSRIRLGPLHRDFNPIGSGEREITHISIAADVRIPTVKLQTAGTRRRAYGDSSGDDPRTAACEQ